MILPNDMYTGTRLVTLATQASKISATLLQLTIILMKRSQAAKERKSNQEHPVQVLTPPTSQNVYFVVIRHKKVAAMYNVSTFEASERIRKAAEVKGDERMLHCLLSVNNDLIAAEARYHKDCLSSYVSRTNLKHQGFDDGTSVHEAAFKELAQSIGHSILEKGRAYDMSSLLLKYQDILEERGVDGASYTKYCLKERLKRYFGCDMEFFQQANKCKSEIVYSSALSIHDLINEAAVTKMQTTASNSGNYESADYQQIRNVAGRIREEIRKSNGIKLRPLDVKEISLETARRIVQPILYMLIGQIICSSEIKGTEISTACKRIEDERKVLTISQDIMTRRSGVYL